MISPFTLHQADDLETAVAILSEHGEEAKVLAGGSELILLLKMGLASPKHIVDISRIADLTRLEFDGGAQQLSIGGLVTHRTLETSEMIKGDFPLLADMERRVANVRVRNIGTLGGNLCFAEPHSDPGTLLLAYEGKITTVSISGERTLSISDFFVDYYETALRKDEIVKKIQVSRLPEGFSGTYLRFCPGERPTVTLAVLLKWNDEACTEARIALGCVGPTPIRATEVEELLKGRSAAEILARAQEAGRMAAALCDPLEDVWGSVEYKRQIVMTLVSRGLSQLSQENSQ